MWRLVDARKNHAIAQLYGIVQSEIGAAQHLFQGVKRKLLHGENRNGDQGVLIYALRPPNDLLWSGSRHEGQLLFVRPPKDRVFVVLVQAVANSDVIGSIEHWNWVAEDKALAGAPLDWERRYTKRLWSRE